MTSRPALPDIPVQANECDTVVAFLDFYRAALLERCWGLTDDQLHVAHPPSNLTLGRLLTHMAFVEYIWFRVRFIDGEMPEPIGSLDFETDDDAEMTMADGLGAAQLIGIYKTAIADSDAIVADAIGPNASGAGPEGEGPAGALPLDALSVSTDPMGRQRNLRWIMIHMIEEYARHCGHADLIREAIDGSNASSEAI